MKHTEFGIISKYFPHDQKKDFNEIKGIEDHNALIKIPNNNFFVVSTDTLIKGTHFLKNITPKNLAYKTVAVNLSDLADMGTDPKWTTLSLTISKLNNIWLEEFSNSFFNVLNKYNIKLIGRDVNRGTLSITLNVYGLIKEKKALLRSNAYIGDLIYVTETLGESVASLFLLQKNICKKFKDKKLFN